MKKTKVNHTAGLLLMIPITAFALYIIHIISGFNNSDGIAYITYESSYPFILLGEYAFITALFIPLALKAKKTEELGIFIFPLMLFSALGMMRIDSDANLTSGEADHSPSLMFIILLVTLIIMFLSKHPVTGTAGTVAGTVFFPAFGLAFSPFIAAASFFTECKNEKEKNLSVVTNCLFSAAAMIFCIIKTEAQEPDFSKKHIPVIFLVIVFTVFILTKKAYELLPLSTLPLFPLLSGILFGAFPTDTFTLAGSVAPFAVLLGMCCLFGDNKKITGYAKKLTHDPVIYIIVAVFILHTAGCHFYNPGFFRNWYI
ncbi:MAG: hypothetical protein IKB08_03540 [Clostridia bacterium]|nr:hypothetical protein [Clostridia bacterium]